MLMLVTRTSRVRRQRRAILPGLMAVTRPRILTSMR